MKSLNTIVNQIIKDNSLEDANIYSKIREIWLESFQNSFEQNITPWNFKNNVLFLKANAPVWRKEVLLQQDIIIKQINASLGFDSIKKIVVY